MKWAPKLGVAVALLAGVIAAVYLIWKIGFDAVLGAVARAGFGGLALLCLFALLVFVSLAFAWYTLLPPAQRRPLRDFYLARVVRDSIAEISPFSPVGGMVAAARLMMLKGMSPAHAAASVAGDATTEAMAQVVFLAEGLDPLGRLFDLGYSFAANQEASLLIDLLIGQTWIGFRDLPGPKVVLADE